MWPKGCLPPVRGGIDSGLGMGQNAKTILLVDDDAALRSSLEFVLGIEGYAVRAYSRGCELLEEKNFPDHGCMVIDQRLPDIEGLQLISALRARSVNLPAILITTNPNRALRNRAQEAAVAIVEKPLLTGTLFQQIDIALR
jgi:FixJ family two-component response regulator